MRRLTGGSRPATRWVRRGLLAGAILLLAGYATVYGTSQRAVNRSYEAPLAEVAFAATPGLLAEGERLARIRGCIGCHGREMEGQVFFDERWVARIVAPDLTRIAAELTDAELERVIRRGVRPDGRGVWVMPSNMFYHLSDEDVAAIIAYIRSVPPRNGPRTEVRLRLLGRVGLATGKFPAITGAIDASEPRMTVNRDDPLSLGRYLALTSCTECHGMDLRGHPPQTPDLRIAAAFSPEAFTRLMREGTGLGGRELGLMGLVGRDRFSHFTDAEIAALHAFLVTLAHE
jgi:mono/diheme cytochrome c family protein